MSASRGGTGLILLRRRPSALMSERSREGRGTFGQCCSVVLFGKLHDLALFALECTLPQTFYPSSHPPFHLFIVPTPYDQIYLVRLPTVSPFDTQFTPIRNSYLPLLSVFRSVGYGFQFRFAGPWFS